MPQQKDRYMIPAPPSGEKPGKALEGFLKRHGFGLRFDMEGTYYAREIAQGGTFFLEYYTQPDGSVAVYTYTGSREAPASMQGDPDGVSPGYKALWALLAGAVELRDISGSNGDPAKGRKQGAHPRRPAGRKEKRKAGNGIGPALEKVKQALTWKVILMLIFVVAGFTLGTIGIAACIPVIVAAIYCSLLVFREESRIIGAAGVAASILAIFVTAGRIAFAMVYPLIPQ